MKISLIVNGEHIGYCNMCEIKRCCREKGLKTCAECPEYICDELDKVYTVMRDVFGKEEGGFAEAKVNLDKIRKNK